MRKILPIMILALLLAGCDDKRLGEVLTTADSLLVEHGDSALHYLEAHEPLKAEGSRSQRMRFDLLRASAQNKAYVDFTSDSVMKEVVDYYDHHGTANDQLQAHYLLGCVYRDLGDAPRAIECFLDAVARADTTAKDCDYKTLGRTYSQMANMYHRQLLLNNEIVVRKLASYYAFLAGDTLRGINDYKMISSPYILQSKNDSAEIILKEAMCQYRMSGYEQEALKASMMLMHLYSDQPEKLSSLKELIDRFEAECNLFDEHHELPPSKRQYYYYKGRYFEEINELDSAEICYRKIYRSGMSVVQKDPMYRGMLSVFQKKHQPDSIAKYATLFAEVNDSSLNLKDQELTAQMAASYNYSLYQKEALEKEHKAHQWKIRLIILSILFLLTLVIVVYRLYLYRINKRKQIAIYNSTLSERNHLQKELAELKEKNYDAVIDQKESKIKELNHSIEKYATVYQQVIAKDRMVDFENSEIAQQFAQMAEFKKGTSSPSKSDWKKLVTEFGNHLPSAYAIMTASESSLSPLQFHVCIMLLLGYEEGVIATLKDTTPQNINNAKVRANRKLFQTNNSTSLKVNLQGILYL